MQGCVRYWSIVFSSTVCSVGVALCLTSGVGQQFQSEVVTKK